MQRPNPFDARILTIRDRLSRPLPGPEIMLEIAPTNRGFVSEAEARARDAKQSAALVLLYPSAGRLHTVLTLRQSGMRNHGGQVSFPGGRRDAGESIWQAARREAWEELAIPEAQLDRLGRLTPVFIPPSRFLLFPEVAAMPSRPAFVAQPSEVAEIIEVPVAHFADRGNRRETEDLFGGQQRRVPYFDVDGHRVWGATAMILRELAEIWRESRAEALGLDERDGQKGR